MEGKVWLVGAGPGDPELITFKGMIRIAHVDVIVYDALCNPKLLSNAAPDCEIIFVGKQAGKHSMKQDDINALLAEKAREGKKVCRLKGGDPFVFGRGGEEALYLQERGIPFEVVPGVTSAVAVPAYAGIPVTHRNLATSVRIVTGHEDPTKPESQLDWAELAATSGTLVFLMGVHNLAAIAERLMTFGKSGDTPVALIANGTLPSQETVTGTLATIAVKAEAENVEPPAILVVGEVVSLREQLQWFEKRPLFGRKIVVTRARPQSSELLGKLQDLGADTIEAPTIRIENLFESEPMQQAVRDLGKFDWLIFTSANALRPLTHALVSQHLDARAFAGVKVAAIGPGTAREVVQMGIFPDLIPERFVAEALLEELAKTQPIKGQSFLIPRSEIARPDLVDGLRSRGGEVREVVAYKTLPEPLPDDLADRLDRGEIDLVTFTSSSTVTNFLAALPEDRRSELAKKVKAASIGPVTSDTLKANGIEIVLEAAESTIPGLLAAIVGHFRKP
ncbi:MAG: uroporphyrinogen-III C-methyltransferase [Candidatus Hydrogenedentes bacterium]|nr:uroporphyrinogen-III C-methyltransferase [Candidatus Hydrogenedentota bacterium]